MNNFKKLYNDTFNDIHAPNSIKQEVICMSKKLNNKNQLDDSNNIVETNQVEVSSGFNFGRVLAFATCIALVGAGAFGLNYFKNSNRDLDVAMSNTESETSISVDSSVQVMNTSLIDNSNFESIFGINLESLKFNYLFGNNQNSVIKYCTSNDDILKVASSLNTSSWIKEDIIPNNDEVTTQLHLTLNTADGDLIMNFYTLKNGSSDIYVRVINEVKYVDACYKVDYNTYNTIYQTVEQNNYFYFDVNPSNSISVILNDDKSLEITDNSIIHSIKCNLFDNFSWNHLYVDDVIKEENLDTTVFKQSYDDVTYSIYLMKYESSLYARVNYSALNQEYNFLYELASNDFEQDYNNLINLIKGNNNIDTSNTVTQVVTTDVTSTSTEKITTTAPVTTTEKVTTTTQVSAIEETTIPNSVTTEVEVTQIHLPLTNNRTFYNDLIYHMKFTDARPQFFDEDLQQYFAEAYSIEQWSAFGSQFNYDDSDYFLVEYEDHNEYYSRITNTEFKTVDDIRNYFKQYFTDDYINKNINMSYFVEQDGKLYGVNGARGGNMQYIGHSFVLDSQSDSRIEFHAEVYYYNGDGVLDLAQLYYQRPTDNMSYDTEICNYVLVKTNDGWRFDTLETML